MLVITLQLMHKPRAGRDYTKKGRLAPKITERKRKDASSSHLDQSIFHMGQADNSPECAQSRMSFQLLGCYGQGFTYGLKALV
jgi:hypothetical protein